MKISIWNVEATIDIIPTQRVFSLILAPDILCDICYTQKIEVNSHFWMKNTMDNETVKTIELSFEEYLIKHLKEIRGMNSFWDINRLEWLTRYVRKWKNELTVLGKEVNPVDK